MDVPMEPVRARSRRRAEFVSRPPPEVVEAHAARVAKETKPKVTVFQAGSRWYFRLSTWRSSERRGPFSSLEAAQEVGEWFARQRVSGEVSSEYA